MKSREVDKKEELRKLLLKKLAGQDVREELSENQTALWYLQKHQPRDTAYNLAFAIRIWSELDLKTLKKSLQKVVHMHSELRAHFPEDSGAPQKIIKGYLQVPFEVVQVDDSPEQLKKLVNEKHHEPFDIENGPLFKACLFQQQGQYVLMLNFHHLVLDGFSFWTILRNLPDIYAGLLSGKELQVALTPIPYKAFVAQQSAWLAGESADKARQYYLNLLAGNVEVLPLRTDRPRIPRQVAIGASIELTFGQELSQKLQAIAKQENVTLYVLLLAAFQFLLYKFSGQSKIITGSPFAGRGNSKFRNTIGFFANSVVCYSDFAAHADFRSLLRHVQHQTLEGLKHQQYPFSRIVDDLAVERSPVYSPVFQVMFDLFQPIGDDALKNIFVDHRKGRKSKLGPWDFEIYDLVNEEAQFDISLSIIQGVDELTGFLKYKANLFDKTTIERYVAAYFNILEELSAHGSADKALVELSILTESEIQTVMDLGQGEQVAIGESYFPEIFEKHTVQNPHKCAAVCGEVSITYLELSQRANRLANCLVSEGLEKGSVIPVLMNRSVDMLVSILAIMKAGCIYLPLDPAHPSSRTIGLISECEAKLLMSTTASVNHLEREELSLVASLHTICLFDDPASLAEAGKKVKGIAQLPNRFENPEVTLHGDDLAYIIYTSGSTGKPKGAMVHHSGMLNHLKAKVNDLQLDADAAIVQNASQNFDISIWQFLSALMVGGTTVIIEDRLILDLPKFLDKLQERSISILEVVPSYLEALLNFFDKAPSYQWDNLNYLLVTGETLKKKLVDRWLRLYRDIPMVNAYGPTEASDDITHHFLTEPLQEPLVPIGKTIQNLNIYIVDAYGQLCPTDVMGEIWVSGIGVGKGYFKDAKRTGEVFAFDPFRGNQDIPLYKTGDLGVLLPDGVIEFHGRKDSQVKINGFRIELGEIEQTIIQIPDIKNVAVKLFGERETPAMVAYVCLSDNSGLGGREIKHELNALLPHYMVPDHYVFLDKLPLTPNGKLDRKALAFPELAAMDEEIWMPETKREIILEKIWKEVLCVDSIRKADTFFTLGGDSIKSIQIAGKAKLEGLVLTSRQIFEYPNIVDQAQVCEDAEFEPAIPESTTGGFQLAPIQHWLFEQDEPLHKHYNMMVSLAYEGTLDGQLLEGVLQQLIAHHDVLRSSFRQENGHWKQYIEQKEAQTILLTRTLSGSNTSAVDSVVSQELNQLNAGFELDKGGLFKALLMKTINGDQLYLIAHHLVIDSISWQIIIGDLITGYQKASSGLAPEELYRTITFGNWVKKNFYPVDKSTYLSQKEYWLSELKHSPETAKQTFSYKYRQVKATLEPEVTHQLIHGANEAFGTRPLELLLSGLVLAYQKLERSPGLTIEVESHGRNGTYDQTDNSRTVGWFTSQFPLKLEVKETIDQTIIATKEKWRQVPDEGAGFGFLRYIEKEPDLVAVATSGWLFNYLGQLNDDLGEGWKMLESKEVNLVSTAGKRAHHLEWNLYVRQGSLITSLTYDRGLLDEALASNLIATFYQSLREIVTVTTGQIERQFTSSDFESADVSQEDLDNLFATFN